MRVTCAFSLFLSLFLSVSCAHIERDLLSGIGYRGYVESELAEYSGERFNVLLHFVSKGKCRLDTWRTFRDYDVPYGGNKWLQTIKGSECSTSCNYVLENARLSVYDDDGTLILSGSFRNGEEFFIDLDFVSFSSPAWEENAERFGWVGKEFELRDDRINE